MSKPHIILDNLPSLCQNCQICWKFDVVITKIILLGFLRHGVVRTTCGGFPASVVVIVFERCLTESSSVVRSERF